MDREKRNEVSAKAMYRAGRRMEEEFGTIAYAAFRERRAGMPEVQRRVMQRRRRDLYKMYFEEILKEECATRE